MKRLILVVLGLGLVAGAALFLGRTKSTTAGSAPPPVDLTATQMVEYQPVPNAAVEKHEGPRPIAVTADKSTTPAAARPADPAASETIAFNHLVGTLVSPQATYDQKQTAWDQLRKAGKLDPLIKELEKRAADEPQTAAYPAALGQAYLQKCAVITDVREQGILAMQADKVFDTALALDPANWEARFTKAVALSFWPANLNKSQEVVDHFLTLVQQQEAQAPQAHFSQTYALLGDQYQKAGQTDDARIIWERGASLYPNDEKLRSKLAPARQ